MNIRDRVHVFKGRFGRIVADSKDLVSLACRPLRWLSCVSTTTRQLSRSMPTSAKTPLLGAMWRLIHACRSTTTPWMASTCWCCPWFVRSERFDVQWHVWKRGEKNCAFCCRYSRESFYFMCWKLLLCEEIRQHCIWTSGEDSHSIKWAITVLSSNSKVCLPLELLKFTHPSDMLARCLSTQQQQTNWSFDFDPVKKWDTHVKGR